ncbi:hypothetical protein B0O80DRAFT_4607 [Mortierella sp. GBAus27b]|nr:hypothetical protein B0O80DRAFT_4607 [Mortierella sp. GBAus27b]
MQKTLALSLALFSSSFTPSFSPSLSNSSLLSFLPCRLRNVCVKDIPAELYRISQGIKQGRQALHAIRVAMQTGPFPRPCSMMTFTIQFADRRGTLYSSIELRVTIMTLR